MAQKSWPLTWLGVSLLTIMATLFSGCAGSSSSFVDRLLHDVRCRKDAEEKAGPDKATLLFVKHHIFVGGEAKGSGSWNPWNFTDNNRDRIKWQNWRLTSFRHNQAAQLIPEMNDIFHRAGINVYLINEAMEYSVDSAMFPASFDLLAAPMGHTADKISRLRREEPGYIHMLWSWTSTTEMRAKGIDYSLVIADDPRSGDAHISARELAHELAITFGLAENPSRIGNLMNLSSRGTGLSQQQRETIWTNLNNQGKDLHAISCPVE